MYCRCKRECDSDRVINGEERGGGGGGGGEQVRRELTFLMSSRPKTSGERPPWTHRNCWFMMAARGRQSNESIHVSYTVSEYLILPAKSTGHSQCILHSEHHIFSILPISHHIFST